MKEKPNQANQDFESWCSNFFPPESEAGHVLKMFLNFHQISGWCSYKLGSYKKKECKTIRMTQIYNGYDKINIK